MYNDFYHFDKKPFNITPNPEFLFLSDNHKEVFAHLLYGIQNHSGFIEVTGEVGTGKTTVLRTLFNQLDTEDYRLAFVFNPALSALELLQTINREFGLQASSSSRSELHAALNSFLLQENRAGRTVVLVIDEAQNLQAEVLEEIRLLSNLETETDKLIQIVLVGQPELAVTLERSDLRQLSQRITVRYHLKPMTYEDTWRYINHRLRVAGHQGGELFSAAAVKEVFRFSRGYPRLINVLCDRSLLVGYTREQGQIAPALVKQAISELGREVKSNGTPGWLKLAILGLVVLAVYAGFQLKQRMDKLEPAAPAVAVVAPEPTPTAATGPAEVKTPPVGLAKIREQLAQLSPTESLQQGSAVVLGSWAIPGFDIPELTTVAQLREACESFGLELLSYDDDLPGLLATDLPALLELYLPGQIEPRYLAISKLQGELFQVSPDTAGGLSLQQLQGLWSGKALIPWRNHLGLDYIGQLNQRGVGVTNLQQLLVQAGYLSEPPNGIYDQQTLESVTRFQADRGLIQDGRVGPLTLIHLYQASQQFQQPRLRVEAIAGGVQ